MTRSPFPRSLLAGVSSLAIASTAFAAGGFVTTVKPYLVPTTPAYNVEPLLSVGDRVPLTGDATREYQMVGIPDGLGARRNSDGTVTVLMNHELNNTVQSQPVVGGPINRGAFVSQFTLAADGSVLSGKRAYNNVYLENTLIGPAAEVGNTTPGFARFCSAALVGPGDGFRDWIYFANEESGGAATFDGKGGLSVAVIGDNAYGLPKLGHCPWENTIAMPKTGFFTVLMGMEDGPTTPDSQLYMYVGFKSWSPGASVLGRNGLDNGKLYVFVSDTAGKSTEINFQNGSIQGHWVEIANAGSLSESELETAADFVGAFGFIRPEDGAFNTRLPRDFYFVTTGSGPGNELGRLYHMEFNPVNILGNTRLTVVYNADQIVAAGGDVALSPDNIEVSDDYLMICEDGTTQSRAAMTTRKRDGSVWRFDIGRSGRIDLYSANRLLSLNPPGRDGVAVLPGIWESSGVIDTSNIFGCGSWLIDVQAHAPTAAPVSGTVEDGQLLLVLPASY